LGAGQAALGAAGGDGFKRDELAEERNEPAAEEMIVPLERKNHFHLIILQFVITTRPYLTLLTMLILIETGHLERKIL
jgi:hypothetical protein